MASTAAEYLPILLFLAVALSLSLSFVVLPMMVAKLTGASNPYPDKLAEYECGFPAFEDSRAQFDVRFYLVAILFIIFDLEAAFLFPVGGDAGLYRRRRLGGDDDLPRRAHPRLRLRLEEGSLEWE
jgi:NADH:ubiquinone oxidoreductase subunit 3 (subunit A)